MPPAKERLIPAILFALGLAGCYLIGFLQPSALNWGFHSLGFLPGPFTALYLIFVCSILAYVFRGNVQSVIDTLAGFMHRHPLRFLLATLAVVVGTAILFRVRIPLLGDGFYLVRNYSEAFRGIAPLYPRDEPLATYYFSFVLGAIGIPTYDRFLEAYFIAEMFLAVGFVINVFVIVRTLIEDPQSRFLMFAALLVLPYMQLFFGYVETYAVVLFMVSLWVASAALYLRDKIPFSYLPGVFLLMALTHYLTVLTIGSFAFLTWHEFKKKKLGHLILGFSIFLSTILIILIMIRFDVAQFSSQVPYSHYLSLTKTSDPIENYAQAYPMFSVYHAIDLANIGMLLCPFMLFLFLMMSNRLKVLITSDPTNMFLFLAILPIVAFLTVVKFDLGAARDWDVFSSYAFIVALLSLHLLYTDKRFLPVKLMSLIILISLANSLIYWSINASTDAALNRYSSLFDARTLSQNGFYGASLQLSLYYHQINETRAPVKLWGRYSDLYPHDERGATNIINNLTAGADDRAILAAYNRWQANNPADTTLVKSSLRFCLDGGKRFFDRKMYADAEVCFRTAMLLDSTHPKAYNNLGSVLALEGKLDSAITMFHKALMTDSTYSDALYNSANAYTDLGMKKKGEAFLRHAAQLGNTQAQHDLEKLKISWGPDTHQ